MPDRPTPILILGAGAFSADVADIVAELPTLELAGFLDARRERCAEPLDGRPVHWIDDAAPLAAEHQLVTAVGDPGRRRDIERLIRMGFSFATVRHPSAQVAASAEIGAGCLIAAGVVIAARSRIADHAIVNRGVTIGHHAALGAFSTLGPGVDVGGGASIGDGSLIGIGATVVNGVKLGHGTRVAAGSVVTRSAEDGAVLAGIPARRVRR